MTQHKAAMLLGKKFRINKTFIEVQYFVNTRELFLIQKMRLHGSAARLKDYGGL